jgi:hypothetical protein
MSFGIYVCIEKYSTLLLPFLDLSPPHIETRISFLDVIMMFCTGPSENLLAPYLALFNAAS